MKFTSTGKASVLSDAVCILFDPTDGAIRYVHRVLTLDGAEETPTPAIEKRALQLAEESGLDIEKFQALHVDGSKIEPLTSYAVDTVKRCLIVAHKVDSTAL